MSRVENHGRKVAVPPVPPSMYMAKTCLELKDLLKRCGLRQTGKKAELAARLQNAEAQGVTGLTTKSAGGEENDNLSNTTAE